MTTALAGVAIMLVRLPLFLASLGAAHVLLLDLVPAIIVLIHTSFLPLISTSLEVSRPVCLRVKLHLANVVLASRVTA